MLMYCWKLEIDWYIILAVFQVKYHAGESANQLDKPINFNLQDKHSIEWYQE